jgi:hypothetical protein
MFDPVPDTGVRCLVLTWVTMSHQLSVVFLDVKVSESEPSMKAQKLNEEGLTTTAPGFAEIVSCLGMLGWQAWHRRRLRIEF